MNGAIWFAIGSLGAMFICGCIIAYVQMLSHRKWLKENARRRVAVPARYYPYSACIKARAITNEDDLEGQAKNLIKSINQDLQKKG